MRWVDIKYPSEDCTIKHSVVADESGLFPIYLIKGDLYFSMSACVPMYLTIVNFNGDTNHLESPVFYIFFGGTFG